MPVAPAPSAALLAQFGVLALGVAAVAAPPAQGPMMLVPLVPGAATGMLADASGRDALLIGRGALPGSYVVAGNRARLLGPMLRRGVLLTAAPPTGCGPA
jgi:hypothetical protein